MMRAAPLPLLLLLFLLVGGWTTFPNPRSLNPAWGQDEEKDARPTPAIKQDDEDKGEGKEEKNYTLEATFNNLEIWKHRISRSKFYGTELNAHGRR